MAEEQIDRFEKEAKIYQRLVCTAIIGLSLIPLFLHRSYDEVIDKIRANYQSTPFYGEVLTLEKEDGTKTIIERNNSFSAGSLEHVNIESNGAVVNYGIRKVCVKGIDKKEKCRVIDKKLEEKVLTNDGEANIELIPAAEIFTIYGKQFEEYKAILTAKK